MDVTDRETIRQRFRTASGRLPVRWTDRKTTFGSFEGADFCIDVFDVPSDQQWAVFERLDAVAQKIADEFGREPLVVLHTVAETDLHYPWVRAEA